MKTKFILFFLLSLLLITKPSLANTNSNAITNIVVFGDSLSDRGFSKFGGFNRYSNGPVWPEYVAELLCRTCLQDYAWGGAKTGYANYNGINWSGVLWQVDRYELNTDPEKTLIIIWVGGNDLINGDVDGAMTANNILIAIDKLLNKGVKNIVVFNLPNLTLVPAYNNPDLAEYKKFSRVKATVKKQIIAYNEALDRLLKIKKESYAKNPHPTNLNLFDFSNFFDHLIKMNSYENVNSPWLGTYAYPNVSGYMWWDSWHPMTSVHKHIANYFVKSLEKINMILVAK